MTNVDKALLLSEWSCRKDDLKTCPVCGAEGGAGTHGIDCAMDLALAERGWGARAERDAAKRFLIVESETIPPPGEKT